MLINSLNHYTMMLCLLIILKGFVYASDLEAIRNQIQIMKQTYEPDPGDPPEMLNVRKQKLEKLIHQINRLKHQGIQNICSNADIDYLNKLQMYYLGMKIYHYGIMQPLEQFYKTYCPTNVQIKNKWCQTVMTVLGKTADFQLNTNNQNVDQNIKQKVFAFQNLVQMIASGKQDVDIKKMFPWFQFSDSIVPEKNIFNLVLAMNAQIKKEMKHNLRYDLYYAFGRLRQMQNRNEDYLQNICIAYIHGNICEKVKILKEMNILKKHIFRDRPLEKDTTLYLTDAGLIQRWIEDTLLEGTECVNAQHINVLKNEKFYEYTYNED